MDIEDIRNEIRKKKTNKKVKKTVNSNIKFLNKIAFTIILTLITLIVLKTNTKFKTTFYKYVLEDNISFISLNNIYQKYLSDVLPNLSFFNKTEPVFNETLSFTAQSKYKDGVALTVSKNYLVPILEAGMVIFAGEKEDYGKTIIIEQIDGLEVWYSNLDNYSVNLYDYVTKGSALGEVVGDKLYLVFKKDGKTLEYEDKL